MKDLFKKIFVNEHCINAIIAVNAFVIILEEYGITYDFILYLDYFTIIFFIGEMVCKQYFFGFREYWNNAWNRLDGALVILSIPTLLDAIFPHLTTHFSFILILRIFRIFRFFRLAHLFPNFSAIAKNFKLALRQSRAILIGFAVIILTFALIGCSLFKNYSQEYFGSPTEAIYTTFRIFTIEGWYEIPNSLTATMSPIAAALTKIYFCLLLIICGILGMSLINAIFVDAMVSDNNDDLIRDMKRLENKLDALLKEKDINPNLFNEQSNENENKTDNDFAD
ncbi:MAG: ion transporter [Paludibacteraceae bacterium]|nr:ion transporter [Paludibacteraceae bacterium]